MIFALAGACRCGEATRFHEDIADLACRIRKKSLVDVRVLRILPVCRHVANP